MTDIKLRSVVAGMADLQAKTVTATAKNRNGGVQYLFTFRNGYGASVVQSPYSYGGFEGMWELAVLDASGSIDYETPVTGGDGVIGWLTDDDVIAALTRVADLPAAVRA